MSTNDERIWLSAPHMTGNEMAYIQQAIDSNWVAPLGPNVDGFEALMTETIGVKHALALSSGTAALHLALAVLGVGRGDSVFCASMTFVASANPILYLGAQPVFIDSTPGSWNMSPQALNKAFAWADKQGCLPKAVVIVNLYGQSADYDALLPICDSYGVPVIEDAAESLGAQYKGKASGRFGRLAIFSFNGNKILSTSGGGMLVSDDGELIERAQFLSTQAKEAAPYYLHKTVGFNYRMSNIIAGIGIAQLKALAARVKAKRAINQLYRESLKKIPAIEWLGEQEGCLDTHWLSVCLINTGQLSITPAKVIALFAEHNIEARYCWNPLHQQPLFSNSPYFTHGEVSVCDKYFSQGLCLPSTSSMTPVQHQRVIELLSTCFSEMTAGSDACVS